MSSMDRHLVFVCGFFVFIHIRSMSQNENPAYPQKAAAKYLGVSLTTLWRIRKAGEIKIVRIGARANVLKSELDTFLARQNAKTNGER